MALPQPSVIVDRVRNQGKKSGRVSISMSGLFRISSGSTKWSGANEPERSFCMITFLPCAPVGNTCTNCVVSGIYLAHHPELIEDLRELALSEKSALEMNEDDASVE